MGYLKCERLVIFFCIFLFSSCVFNVVRAVGVIPLPKSIEYGFGHFELNSSTKLYTNIKGLDRTYFQKYLNTLPVTFGKGDIKSHSNIIKLIIEPLGYTSNSEAYNLHVTSDEIEIKANTSSGLFYGLQTCFQLAGGIAPKMSIPSVKIIDEPRFSYRGYMLDVSRHFFPKEFILKLLDIMSYYKMNVFHFHIADTGGWRVEIKKYPKLTELTAYRPFSDLNDWASVKNVFCKKETENSYGGYYTQNDIREIVSYATARHIDVIPEIDMPGHSRSVLWAYPELACHGKEASECNELCIGNEKTFEFCQNVLMEIMNLFPSKYIHIGGDEANRQIWNQCDLCKKRMKEEYVESVEQWQAYFTNRIERFVNNNGKSIIGWDEIMDGDISKNAVVMSWREEVGSGSEAPKRGFKVIQSPTSHCYLDYYQDNPFYEPTALMGYTPLSKIYSFEPIPEGEYDKSLVLGVQCNLWTEYVPSVEHAEYMFFPRALAIAEVGWIKPELKSYENFKQRALYALSYLKKNKGVHPFNLSTEIGPRLESLYPVFNMAKGKTVTYMKPYSLEFVGSKESTLTDGLLGNWNANGDRWQGFGREMDVVIDMEESTEIHAVKASFIFVPTGGEYLPETIEVLLSDDGEHYRSVYSESVSSDNNTKYRINCYGWTGLDKARYIRYRAFRHGGWGEILSDEVIVK